MYIDNDINPFLAAFAYDALWTFALALNRTNEMVGSLTIQEVVTLTRCERRDVDTLVSLENFSYSNQLMGCIIRWNLERTDFVGVSVSFKVIGLMFTKCMIQGRITFDENGSRVHSHVEVHQYRLKEDTIYKIPVAYIRPLNKSFGELFYRDKENNNIVYPSTFHFIIIVGVKINGADTL